MSIHRDGYGREGEVVRWIYDELLAKLKELRQRAVVEGVLPVHFSESVDAARLREEFDALTERGAQPPTQPAE